MAKTGQAIENPVTGQRIVFLTSARENGGTQWAVEWFIQPHKGKFPPEHRHPAFAEQFEILAGAARYRLGGREMAAKAGDTVTLPAGPAHRHPWSVSDEGLHMRHRFTLPQPDLPHLEATEVFFETLFGLARDGKVDKNGAPHPLQFAVLAATTGALTYLPGVPIALQEAGAGLGASLGRALGFSARYAAYSDAA